MTSPPTIGITTGDPRGIGPEVTAEALKARRGAARFVWIAPPELPPPVGVDDTYHETVSAWNPDGGDVAAGRVSGEAIDLGIRLALEGAVDGLVTGPISKAALNAAGFAFPGHTEFLRDRTGAPEVTMMVGAERTALGGALRLALLTAHVPLGAVLDTLDAELAWRRSRIAIEALQAWWGIENPRLVFAGINPHAGEGGLLGDDESRVLAPAIARLEAQGVEVLGIQPGDTVFQTALAGRADLVVTPYHDVGLAVLKTIARDDGVNVTAGLPFPRTSPDHGTAFDIAGTGRAHPGAMIAALDLCTRFCLRRAA